MHQDLKKQQQQQTSTTTQLLCLPLTDRTWTVRRDIGHHITTCSAIKAVEEEGGRSGFQSGHCFSPFFPHLLSCLYPDPWVFFTFVLPAFSSCPAGDREWASGYLGAWLLAGSTHLSPQPTFCCQTWSAGELWAPCFIHMIPPGGLFACKQPWDHRRKPELDGEAIVKGSVRKGWWVRAGSVGQVCLGLQLLPHGCEAWCGCWAPGTRQHQASWHPTLPGAQVTGSD